MRWTGNTSQTFQTVLNGPINTGRGSSTTSTATAASISWARPRPSASAPNVWATSLNLGGIFESPHYPKTPIKRDPQVTTAVDFDGDGRVEILVPIWARGRSRPTGSPMAWAGRRSSIPMAASRRISTQTVGPSTCLATSTVTVCRTHHDQPGGLHYGDLRWNTGNGFSPPIKAFIDQLEPGRDEVKVRVADMNRDGRDDLVTFSHSPPEGITILLSRGDGLIHAEFPSVEPTGDSAGPKTVPAFRLPDYWPLEDIYSTSKIGDFNGDGFPDIVRLQTPTASREIQLPHDSLHTLGFDCSSADVRAIYLDAPLRRSSEDG